MVLYSRALSGPEIPTTHGARLDLSSSLTGPSEVEKARSRCPPGERVQARDRPTEAVGGATDIARGQRPL